MGARRVIALAVLVTALGALPASAFADTYPPQVEPTEVVTDDATPPVTDVDADQVVAPGSAGTVDPGVDPVVDPAVEPAVDALSSTGAGVLPLVLVALALLVVGGGLATLSQRRRTNSTA